MLKIEVPILVPGPFPGRAAGDRPLLTGALVATLVLTSGLSVPNRAASDPADSVATSATAPPRSGAGLARMALDLGFENVTESGGGTPMLAYENRRFRHSIEAIANLRRQGAGDFIAVERRFGLAAAAIAVSGPPERPTFRVRYPSDRDYPGSPTGARQFPTSRSVDLLVGPLFAYELGRLTDPYQFRIDLEPRVRYHPWPGARATASMIVPIHNDFAVSDLHPDVEQVRPGLLMIEQFAWIPRIALASATAGVFANNRYGLSLGAARPIAEGTVLFDSQLDFTGFLAFPETGAVYSAIEQVSGFAGVTWRWPWYDVSVSLRAARFLYGDDGPEVLFKRSLGDVDVSLSMLRSGVINLKTLRVTLPVPPLVRSTHHPVRGQLIERFPVSYRTDASPVGVHLTAVADREDFLRQLNRPALEANRDRYDAAYSGTQRRSDSAPLWVSLSGMTGFVNTPRVDAMVDRGIEVSYSHVPKKWAYDERGKHANQAYSVTLGVLPRVEAAFRFTRIPGRLGFLPDDPDNELTTDTDHMASGRLTLLTPTTRRPGLAVGVEDVEGTRRFHSSYLVSGMPIEIMGVQSHISLGYAPRVFTATRYVLDGGFGAFEVSPWRVVAARIEYDSEKTNVGIGVDLGFGLRLRAAALKLETLSGGVSWFHKL